MNGGVGEGVLVSTRYCVRILRIGISRYALGWVKNVLYVRAHGMSA